jgi:hypothetical protein
MTPLASRVGAIVLLLGSFAAVQAQRAPERVPLFDGKTLEGWQGDAGTWRVEDGAIVAGSLTASVPHNEFLATTREYGNFVLRLKVKLLGTEGFVNGGVQFRSQRLTDPAYEMIGYQADLGKTYWGTLYDESRRKKTLARPKGDSAERIVRTGGWNDYEIRAEGPRIRLSLNGTQTVDYTERDPRIPQKGLIALQVHGGGRTLIAYKDITIEELP